MSRKPDKATVPHLIANNKEIPVKINSAVVIPALNPSLNLVGFVKELIKNGIPEIIVVNDGSHHSFRSIFDEIEQLEHCTVLTHERNRGKGRALKTAFSYFIRNYPHLDGVVTADADGQHSIEDICRICEMLTLKQGSLILGVRNFKEENVPKRSYIGNLMTSCIFQALFGFKLNDTQTGLRGIPADQLHWMVELKGERYDFETNMLIYARQNNIHLLVIPIKTLYFDNNSGSHYSTIKDSAFILLRLVSGFVRYSMSSIASGILDLAIFSLLNAVVFTGLTAPVRILLCTSIARIVSSAFNYFIDKTAIFSNVRKPDMSAFRFYIPAVINLLCSSCLVYVFSLLWNVSQTLIKLFVDMVLGYTGYRMQLRRANLKNNVTGSFTG